MGTKEKLIKMDNLEYKGYYGSIEYSSYDDCLFGKVLGMPDNCITYEGNTTSELFADFKGAIDFYLDYCKRKGIKPRKG
jgi:predicted HicB family RNase H-like nuclease